MTQTKTLPTADRSLYGPVESCQVCGFSPLASALFLGYLPPVNLMRPLSARPNVERVYPAELLQCHQCGLVQLGYAVEPHLLFPPEYPYTSGSTRILRENFAELFREVSTKRLLQPDDLIADIGSNDGTLLDNFLQGGYRVVGIEPTLTAKLAQQRGIPSVMAFLNDSTVGEVLERYGPAAVATATNVFAHMVDVHGAIRCIENLVGDGVFISESHYVRDLIEGLQYDTIYHEHLRYYSLSSLRHLLSMHGFRVFDAKRISTHGGSLRVYASRSERYAVQDSVSRILAEEEKAGLADDRWVPDFRKRVSRSKLNLYELLAQLRRGGSIFGVGAPSRASTLINYVGLDSCILECVVEIPGSKKVENYIPGTDIPILDESKLYQEQPPAALLLSWHIADELCGNLKRRGYTGDFIVPLPEPRVIYTSEVTAG